MGWGVGLFPQVHLFAGDTPFAVVNDVLVHGGPEEQSAEVKVHSGCAIVFKQIVGLIQNQGDKSAGEADCLKKFSLLFVFPA